MRIRCEFSCESKGAVAPCNASCNLSRNVSVTTLHNLHEALRSVIPPNWNTFSDCRRACHGSKLTNSQGRAKLTNFPGKRLELSTRTWSGSAPLAKNGKFEFVFVFDICVLFYFEVRGIAKHLMTGPTGRESFVSPRPSMSPKTLMQWPCSWVLHVNSP